MIEAEFTGWVAAAMDACMNAPPEHVYGCGCSINGDEMAAAFGTEKDFPAITVEFNEMLTARPSVGFLATKTLWSPTWKGESSEAWSLVVVTPELPAWFGVRRIKEDQVWHPLDPESVPWFLLSSAGGLRHSLATGEPPVMKHTNDERLLLPPTKEPHPPKDEHGLL